MVNSAGGYLITELNFMLWTWMGDRR